MALEIRPVTPRFVAEIRNIDLSQPLGRSTYAELEAAIAGYGALLFRGQSLDDESQLAFSRGFGPLETAPTSGKLLKDGKQRLASNQVGDVSNLDADNKPRPRTDRRRLHELANRLWHTDSSFRSTPAKFSLLYAHVVPPEGGETQLADMKSAYDALPDRMKADLEPMIVEHHLMYSRGSIGFTDYAEEERAAFPPVHQRLIRYLPDSGRKSLYLASHASHIVDAPIPEGRVLLRDLVEHATQREFIYTHKWRPGDLLMWDNRCTMHRARPFDEHFPRDLRRTTVEDIGPSTEQPMAAA